MKVDKNVIRDFAAAGRRQIVLAVKVALVPFVFVFLLMVWGEFIPAWKAGNYHKIYFLAGGLFLCCAGIALFILSSMYAVKNLLQVDVTQQFSSRLKNVWRIMWKVFVVWGIALLMFSYTGKLFNSVLN